LGFQGSGRLSGLSKTTWLWGTVVCVISEAVVAAAVPVLDEGE
jgi:hypothetical protein